MAEVRVVVYDSVITAMSEPGGMVFKWAYQRRQKVERLAKTLAPKRTGHMASKISASYDKVPNGVVMYVTSPVHYSAWVHEGTRPFLSENKMFIPPNPPFWPNASYVYFRRGQRAQPFLRQALEVVIHSL